MIENPTFAFIKTDKKLIKIFLKDISMIKGLGNYVEVHTIDNKRYIYYKTLKDLIESLPDEFMRVHNSYIINLMNIESFEDNHLICGDLKITVAKSYKECLQTALGKMML
ncbi:MULTISPECIES: LytR/AlgR family response regulator transcription factor [unclassified Chryseobacterium]|uniref:LytR/AlgR family response regulator transcription factor n=1 Tax=unclassified Chryseobacterium TaxID=2593645 RepID=UPI001AE684AB|nr:MULTISPECIES: LytTR family DNA-binding domain-containing protein [unclassified Chryseobacterium]MBP1164047.1 DNA-binding LytR/AlgR family response regulator [Chryseobacterium sp. PvR013]MDR4892119.1 LytTR family DNA-binding domain-containing protein [Chryseobacterium sp. CFS7]